MLFFFWVQQPLYSIQPGETGLRFRESSVPITPSQEEKRLTKEHRASMTSSREQNMVGRAALGIVT